MPDSRFGPFELIAPLATGGMAQTHLARRDGAARRSVVALKRILPDVAGDSELRALFVEETRIARSLVHPNVVRTLDAGEVDGELYLTMEYVRGVDLRAVARTGARNRDPIPRRLVAHVCAEAALGLDYAHGFRSEDGEPMGLVHRDVSPPNLMVDFDGDVVVVDFGIATLARRYQRVRAGQLKGKFAYMSPEQVSGLPLDRRSDVFSLGVILYEFTVGRRLFRAGSDVATMAAIAEAAVAAPSALDPQYPPDLERCVMKALARDPDERFATASEFAQALRGYAGEAEACRRELAGWMRRNFAEQLAELQRLTQPVGGAGSPDSGGLVSHTKPAPEATMSDRDEEATETDAPANPDDAPAEAPTAAADPDATGAEDDASEEAKPEPESTAPESTAPGAAESAGAEDGRARAGTGAEQVATADALPSKDDALPDDPMAGFDDFGAADSTVHSAVHELPHDSDNDPFFQANRGSRGILAFFGLIVLGVGAIIAYKIATEGLGTTHLADYDPGPSRADFEPEPMAPPEPPPTTPTRIASSPEGAAIVVNGIATRRTTPAEVALVDGAVNLVSLHMDGHQTAFVEASAGTAVNAALTPLPPPEPAAAEPTAGEPAEPIVEGSGEPIDPGPGAGRGRIVVVAKDVSGAEVDAEILVNGEPVGTAPVRVDVDAGVRHHITARMAGLRDTVTYARTIEWADRNSERVVTLELTADAGDANRLTSLRFRTAPADATVLVDGEREAPTGIVNVAAPGHHVVRITAEDHEPLLRTVDARVGQMVIDGVLEPIRTGPTTLTLTVDPPETQVYVERLRHGSAGATQLQLPAEAVELESGDYQVTLQFQGEEGRVRERFETTFAPGTHHTVHYALVEGAFGEASHTTAPVETSP